MDVAGLPIPPEREVGTLDGFQSPAARWAAGAGLAATYFIAAKLGLKIAFVHASATAVWPPAGIALASLLILGYRFWPGIFLGAFLANVTTAGSPATSIGISIGNTLEALTAAYLVNRFCNGRLAFNRTRDIFKFAALAGVAAPLLSATIGVTSLCLGGYADWGRYGPIWLTWLLGDGAGIIALTPALLLWRNTRWTSWRRGRVLEAFLLMIAVFIVGLIVFGGLLPLKAKNYPLDFACLPVLIWSAFRFSKRETATVSLLMSVLAIWGTLRGYGPFALATHNDSLLLLQIFLASSTIITLALAALVSERRFAARLMREAQQSLESQVRERTEELRQKSAELTRSNAELEQFATIVSHELQEPLRKILTFGDLIKTMNKDPEKEETQYLHKMEDAARRMQQLVEDILSLSRLTTNAKPLESVDLRELVLEIAADFESRVLQAGGRIEIGPLPILKADSLQMRQLFVNLIGNAFKFRKKDEPPLIAVSSQRSGGGFARVDVSDNGIGFEDQYAERIFKPFQRLNRKNDYPGSGMGLAICQRILMRHGGEIMAKSEPDKGSVFTVILPAQEG